MKENVELDAVQVDRESEIGLDIDNYFFPRGHGNESCNLIGS